jgi:hypothetical protein
MLKSELVISEDLELLNRHIKQYSIRFSYPIFSDDLLKEKDLSDTEGYKKERSKMISLANSNNINHNKEARNTLIPQMFSERELFVRIYDVIIRNSENREQNIDPIIEMKALRQMTSTMKAIEECCVADRLTGELLNEYYDESLLLLVSFTAIRSCIATIKGLRNKFQSDNTVCALRFSHTAETSLSIIQQQQIINFVAIIFSSFFEEYLDIISTELDTGSPILDILIRINRNTNVTWDVTKSFSDFFNYLNEGDRANSIRAHKKICKQLNQDLKMDIEQLKSLKAEMTQEEYEKRLAAILDNHDQLRKNQIAMVVNNTSIVKKLERIAPLLIEDSSNQLPEAT